MIGSRKEDEGRTRMKTTANRAIRNEILRGMDIESGRKGGGGSCKGIMCPLAPHSSDSLVSCEKYALCQDGILRMESEKCDGCHWIHDC